MQKGGKFQYCCIFFFRKAWKNGIKFKLYSKECSIFDLLQKELCKEKFKNMQKYVEVLYVDTYVEVL